MTVEEILERQESRLTELEEANGRLVHENQRLLDELKILTNRLFRSKSERLDPRQLMMFLQEQDSSEEQSEPVAEPAPAKETKKKGHGRSTFREDLPRITVNLEVPESERQCRDCGSELKRIGEDVTERGHIIPARMVVHRYIRGKYACPCGCGIKTSPLPPSLVDKCKYEASVYAHLAVAKYGDHLPLHRLESIFRRHGTHLPKSTMWEMLSRLDEIVVQPIAEQMHQEILAEDILQADETPVTLLLEDHGGSKKSYLWSYGWKEKRVFVFTMTRGRDGPRRFLGKWKGVLQSDGYSGYDEVERINGLERAGCWAHVRRKLKDAMDTGSKSAARVMIHVQRLFRVENELKKRATNAELSTEAVRDLTTKIRLRFSRRILNRLQALAEKLRKDRAVTPKSQLGKALTYIHRQWDTLERFIEHPDLPIHNNDAERHLRHMATGRKNWMFYGSPKGGRVGANIASLVLTCKTLDINPEEYLEDVIQRIDATPASKIASLTPWAWKAAREVEQAAAVA